MRKSLNGVNKEIHDKINNFTLHKKGKDLVEAFIKKYKKTQAKILVLLDDTQVNDFWDFMDTYASKMKTKLYRKSVIIVWKRVPGIFENSASTTGPTSAKNLIYCYTQWKETKFCRSYYYYYS